MSDVKEKIIEGAVYCFERYGYSKTTLEDIGKSAGLKKNSLYHYFKNKEELFFIVLEKEMNRYSGIYKKDLNKIDGIKGKITAYFEKKIQGCQHKSILSSILAEIWEPAHPLYNRVYEIFHKQEINYLESLFKQALENNEIIDYDYKKLSESLSLIFGFFKQQEMSRTSPQLTETKNQNMDDQIIFIIDTLLKAILK